MGWTTIDGNTSWQELAIAQEIAEAFNARALAFRSITQYSTPAAISPDEDMTVFDFVYAVQDGVEFMAQILWGDPDATLAGQDAVIAPYGSTAGFMTAAGLTEEGYWRRVPEGDSAPNPWGSYTGSGWLYGKITDKDLAGPWLFKDLQTALAKMTRVVDEVLVYDYYGATDEGVNLSSPSSPAGAPSYGNGIAWTGLMRVLKVVTAYREDPARYDYLIELNHSKKSFSGQPLVLKTARIVGIPGTCRTHVDYAYTDEAVYGFTPGVTNIMGFVETADAAFDICELKEDTWGFFNAKAWPSVPVLEEGQTFKTAVAGAEVSGNLNPVVVIDYAFDP
jgi:hypothetical protein